METVFKTVLFNAIAFAYMVAISLVAGTMVWILWPVVVPNMLPRVVNEAWITPHLSWIQSVGLSMLLHSLIGTPISTNKNDS